MNRLEADLSVPVIYAGSDVPGKKYVAIQQPNSTPRRTFTSRGQEVVLSCRCHVHAPKGKVPPLEAQNLASQVDDSLTGNPLDIGPDHENLDLAPPNKSEQRYDMDPQTQAHDEILTFTLKTHNLTS